MNNLIFYTCTSTNVQTYTQSQKCQYSTNQSTMFRDLCTFVPLQPFFIQRILSAEKPFVCILISGEIKNKNNSYLKSGGTHA